METKKTVEKEISAKKTASSRTDSEENTAKKKMIKISFTGRELTTGNIFDTNIEKDAKEANIFDEKKKYVPLTIILGEREMLPLIEKELETMKAGEERIVKLGAKDGFGERKAELVRVMPLIDFKNQKINPVPGLLIRAEQYIGKVQSVSGGRVRVDFNNPLSGRELEYKIKLEGEVKDKEKICEEIFEKYYSRIPEAKKEIKNEELYITLSADAYKNLVKVNETIATLGKELGIKMHFREAEAKEEKKKSGGN
ncbi:MAG: FKBP-type peptidyl-prolyl cis-trans isomerase [archaeon]